MNELTAAHKTLPFGSLVKVTNLTNHKSVVVRINDRGPFKANRIIDLSKAAAGAIDMIGTGTTPVRLEVLQPGSVEPKPGPR
jgi:rare lipoprotein A